MANEVEVTSAPAEEAKLLDGKVASGEIRASLKAEIADIQKENPAFAPGLAIVQVYTWASLKGVVDCRDSF